MAGAGRVLGGPHRVGGSAPGSASVVRPTGWHRLQRPRRPGQAAARGDHGVHGARHGDGEVAAHDQARSGRTREAVENTERGGRHGLPRDDEAVSGRPPSARGTTPSPVTTLPWTAPPPDAG